MPRDDDYEEPYKKLRRKRDEGGERKYAQFPDYKHEHLARPGDPYKPVMSIDSKILVHPHVDKRTERGIKKFIEDAMDMAGKTLADKVEKTLQGKLRDAIEHAYEASTFMGISGIAQGGPSTLPAGMALKIAKGFQIEGKPEWDQPDNIDELVDTFTAFGSNYLREEVDGMSRIMEAVLSIESKVHKDILEDIGDKAANHMKRAAYRTVAERRGGPPKKHATKWKADFRKVFGGAIDYEEFIKSYTVSRWEGPHPVMRTGHLRESITYKVTMDPRMEDMKPMDSVARATYRWNPLKGGRSKGLERLEDYDRELDMAISLQIGPGVGDVMAPHYALVVNDGAGPGAMSADGMPLRYIPNPRKYASGGQGYMAKVGMRGQDWRGFEGKHYMEETGHWLVRETPRARMKAEKLAEVYASKAIREVRSELGDRYTAAMADLESIAMEWISAGVSVSTRDLLQDLAEHLLRGFDVGEG